MFILLIHEIHHLYSFILNQNNQTICVLVELLNTTSPLRQATAMSKHAAVM